MRYLVTTSAGEQTTVESDLPHGSFSAQYPLTTDVQPIASQDDAPVAPTVPKKRIKAE